VRPRIVALVQLRVTFTRGHFSIDTGELPRSIKSGLPRGHTLLDASEEEPLGP